MRKMISVRVEEETDRALERLAFETGKPKAELVEKAIRKLLETVKRVSSKRLEEVLR